MSSLELGVKLSDGLILLEEVVQQGTMRHVTETKLKHVFSSTRVKPTFVTVSNEGEVCTGCMIVDGMIINDLVSEISTTVFDATIHRFRKVDNSSRASEAP